VAKSTPEQELREHFARFGDIDYVSVVRDRATKESKGFAYVKFHRMSHAAKAYEECDRAFRPVFADPKPQKNAAFHEGSGGSSSNGPGGPGDRFGGPGSTASGSTAASLGASYDLLSYMDTSAANPEGICRLSVSVSPNVNQDQVWRLFDLVPGLDYCDRPRDNRGGSAGRSRQGLFTVVFNNPQSATYAKEKLHGFEYPPGHRMVVRFDHAVDQGQPGYNNQGGTYNRGGFTQPRNGVPNAPTAMPGAPVPPVTANGVVQQPQQRPNLQTDLAHLTETIANATALLQAAGYASSPAGQMSAATAPPAPVVAGTGSVANPSVGATVNAATGETYDPSYCSVKLPPPQPLAAMDSAVEERLFIVCTPIPPQPYALKDVFGRFGGLIDVYMLHGKTCGYAKYASKESADRAVSALHGQEICGSRLKVMPADPQDKPGGVAGDPGGRKRAKISQGDA